MELIDSHLCFGGEQRRYRHASQACGGDMVFSVFLPPGFENSARRALYWLSGLTCNDENFVQKAGAQRAAAAAGIALVVPDTSPRQTGLPGATEAWDLGEGAGFYLDASQAPWAGRFRMYDYVVNELPALLADAFGLDSACRAVSGHSMGGHGALVVGLRNPDHYRCISAFAPICAASRCPWGQKALRAYLGPDRACWREWDASALLESRGASVPLLVDQGAADAFLQEQLQPGSLQEACRRVGADLHYREHAGYDHSYFFVASFIEDHVRWHAKALLPG